MVKVFRVENEDGEGIYISGIARKISNSLDIDLCKVDRQHPCPWDDSGMSVAWGRLAGKESYFFAFSSWEQFRAWFFLDDFLIAADDLGYKLVVYEVPIENVVSGHTQVVFRKKDPSTQKLATLSLLCEAKEAESF